MDDKDRERLRALVLGCAARGTFTLSSGKTSDFYFDARKVTLTPEGSRLVGAAVLEAVRQFDASALGGPATAACPMISAAGVLASQADVPLKLFYVRDEPKKHGTKKTVEGPALDRADRVLLVDDVVTSGRSLVKAAKRVREETGATILGALAIVDREEGGGEALERENILLDALFRRAELVALLPPAPGFIP